SPELVRRIVEARMRPALEELPDFGDLPSIHPFNDEQIERIARAEPTLRDMLQQFRHLFDHLVYGGAPVTAVERDKSSAAELPPGVKSIMVVEAPMTNGGTTASARASGSAPGSEPHGPLQLSQLWDQEMQAARAKLEPEGALTGATRELQAGLGTFLQ